MVRFSSVRGTESAMVAMATSLRKEGSVAAEADELGCRLGVVAGRGFEQCLGEFEGDGGAAEVLARVGAVRLVGIEDGEGWRCAVHVVGKVVVGDDEVDPERAASSAAAMARMPVSTEMTRRTPSAAASAMRVLHAVAFANAVGDVVADVRRDVEGGCRCVRRRSSGEQSRWCRRRRNRHR